LAADGKSLAGLAPRFFDQLVVQTLVSFLLRRHFNSHSGNHFQPDMGEEVDEFIETELIDFPAHKVADLGLWDTKKFGRLRLSEPPAFEVFPEVNH
jgi:hypothetical protein